MLVFIPTNNLGYLIDESGVRPSIENVEFVLNYPIPRNTKEIQKFVFLACYFRRFSPQFSILAKPLYDILKKMLISILVFTKIMPFVGNNFTR